MQAQNPNIVPTNHIQVASRGDDQLPSSDSAGDLVSDLVRPVVDVADHPSKAAGLAEIRAARAAIVEDAARTGESVRDQIRLVWASGAPVGRNERRRESRRPYPYPIYLTPVADDDSTRIAEDIVVVGKHISELGLDFYHKEPLPFRRMIASLDCGEERWVGLLVDLTWCRFTRHGWYDNGGRFVRPVPSPLGEARSEGSPK